MIVIKEHSLYLYLLLIATFVVIRLPFIGIYIRVVNTLVHEVAHGFVALITSGTVLKIELFSNSSGSTISSSKSKIGQFLTALAGYPLSALACYALFYLISINYSFYIIVFFLCLSVVLLLLFVRNFYGIFWLITFSALCIFMLIYKSANIIENVSIFFASILLCEAIYTPLALFVMSVNSSKDAGDAELLHKITKIPSVIWALVFVCVNLYIVFQIYLTFIKY